MYNADQRVQVTEYCKVADCAKALIAAVELDAAYLCSISRLWDALGLAVCYICATRLSVTIRCSVLIVPVAQLRCVSMPTRTHIVLFIPVACRRCIGVCPQRLRGLLRLLHRSWVEEGHTDNGVHGLWDEVVRGWGLREETAERVGGRALADTDTRGSCVAEAPSPGAAEHTGNTRRQVDWMVNLEGLSWTAQDALLPSSCSPGASSLWCYGRLLVCHRRCGPVRRG